jgi:hypothetical protein
MKTKTFLILLLVGFIAISPAIAEEENRNVDVFSEISLRVSGKLYLKQGSQQSVKVIAKSETLEELITEVRGRELIIRFPNKNMFFGNFNPGKIEIYITVPDIDALGVSGSGDIIADELEARIIDLAVSGSGNIEIDGLESQKVKAGISGSGNIALNGEDVAEELRVSISGSGNFDGSGFEAEDVSVSTSGSGNCKVISNGSIKARIAGSGNVLYNGNASIDASVAGSGKVKKM